MEKRIEKKVVFAATELIDYATGGIVSKEFVHSPAGSITLFAFDQGQGLSEHIAPFDAVIEVLDGTAEIMIDGQRYHPQAGEMLIIPQNAPHAVYAHERFKMMLTMIRG